MERSHWKRRMLLGAAIGAACSLFHRETRQGAKECTQSILEEIRDYRSDPAKAIHDLKTIAQSIDDYSEAFITQLDEADSLVKKRSKPELKSVE